MAQKPTDDIKISCIFHVDLEFNEQTKTADDHDLITSGNFLYVFGLIWYIFCFKKKNVGYVSDEHMVKLAKIRFWVLRKSNSNSYLNST